MSFAGAAWSEVDRGWRLLFSTMRAFKAQKPHVKVGVLGGDGDGGKSRGDLTNAELAVLMEYGSSDGKIPARSFVGATIAANRDRYFEFIEKLLIKVYEGKLTGERVLDLLGMKAASDIKQAVTTGAGIPPPNAPSTVAKKGSARPLIDTGRLIGSVSWVVVLFGGGDDAE